MLILPAIDIKDGQTVRLYQGDYAQVTTYETDPVEVALRWQAAGASWLHVVDLDGAAQGHPVNTTLIGRIRASTSLHIELGGGMRSLTDIQSMLNLGIDRVILGTSALTNRALLDEALTRWDERIAVGLDARNGLVAISGWRETSQIQATALARELSAAGVRRFIYTDIARDGVLQGPNLAALQEMQQALVGDRQTREMRRDALDRVRPDQKEFHAGRDQARPYAFPGKEESRLIASGGVSSLDDLRSLSTLAIEGAIVGKALYTGAVDLAAAIQEIEKGGKPC